MGFPQGEPLSSDNIFFAVKTTKKYHKDRGILDFIFSFSLRKKEMPGHARYPKARVRNLNFCWRPNCNYVVVTIS